MGTQADYVLRDKLLSTVSETRKEEHPFRFFEIDKVVHVRQWCRY